MRITYAEIDLNALKHNFEVVKKLCNQKGIIATVKANAYGHGIIQVSKTLVEAGTDYLGVGFLEEGLLLRRNGFTVPILVLGGVLFSQVQKFLEHDLEITISSLGLAYSVNKQAEKFGKKAKIHLKFDTGMNRIGINFEKARFVLSKIKTLQNIELVGIYSHFAVSDLEDKSFTELQISRFCEIRQIANELEISTKFFHIANSGGIINHQKSVFDLVRAGIMLFGISPVETKIPTLDLIPVMSFKSKVVFLKEVKAGEGISYGLTYQTMETSKIATIPVGYGDGYTRLLSNKSCVLIRGKRFPVVGTICMDQLMVNLGNDSEIQIGDEVVLYGKQGSEEITINEIAKLVGTIPYEITCWLARRVPRVYKNH
ncbi:alanine racemase [bacterium]|nr:alanine racemase [bacterium]